MYFGTKADLLVPLEKDLPKTTTFLNVDDGEIIDGCVLLRLIPPIKDSTFSQYMVNLTGEFHKKLNMFLGLILYGMSRRIIQLNLLDKLGERKLEPE